MPIISDLLKGDTGKGLAIGIGAAILAPVAFAVLSGAARPVARAAVKSGILLYEKGREKAAEFGEVMEDLAAEARAEIEQSHAAADVTANVSAGAVHASEDADVDTSSGEGDDSK
jgi:hypothetical protein